MLFIIALFISVDSDASTICSFDCPGGGGGGGPQLPSIVEIAALDSGNLVLVNDGLILLDIDVFDNLPGLSIAPSTPVYFGLGNLPPEIVVPDFLRLDELAFTGTLTITGAAIDYVLLRRFAGTSLVDLTTTDGILVMDTGELFVPLPGAALLFFSGIFMLIGFGARKTKTDG